MSTEILPSSSHISSSNPTEITPLQDDTTPTPLDPPNPTEITPLQDTAAATTTPTPLDPPNPTEITPLQDDAAAASTIPTPLNPPNPTEITPVQDDADAATTTTPTPLDPPNPTKITPLQADTDADTTTLTPMDPPNPTEITPLQDDTGAATTTPTPPEPTMASQHPPMPNSSTSQAQSTPNPTITTLFKLISSDLCYIEDTSRKLKDYEDHVGVKVKDASSDFVKLEKDRIGELIHTGEDEIDSELRKLKKAVRKLKLPIPSKFKINYADPDSDLKQLIKSSTEALSGHNGELRGKIPLNLYENQIFLRSAAFKDFEAIYTGLDINLKLCLLCFSVFPEGAVIKKRLMVYWWMGEGFTTAEELGTELFNKLIATTLITPANQNRSPLSEVDSCEMHPFVRSAVITVAHRAEFFHFDGKGNPTEDYSSSFRSCLMGTGLANFDQLENLHMLFNVNEAILEFKPEWFLKMRNVNVLYLGRWKASGKHHIEVEDTKFLEGLKYMKHLKFLSLQGVSRITELPNSVSKLGSLTILDLRACHNLEAIPNYIGLLTNLTHLDMSECYLLDRVPKQLSSLENLLVLKGFVVGDSEDKSACTLEALARLHKLRKLSIYTAMKKFPEDKHLVAFRQFNSLSKLTISWGGGEKKSRNEEKSKSLAADAKTQGGKTKEKKKTSTAEGNPNPGVKGLPEKLVKLDLQCFAGKITPEWLKPGELKGLKKLYIRGGELHYLRRGQARETWTWTVETLRLKYLNELVMGWKELHNLFPKLIYLEKVRCPKLTLFPCNEFGVWMKKKEIQGSSRK